MGDDSLIGIQSVLEKYPVELIEPMFTQAEIEHQKESPATSEQMPDLNLWFRFKAASGTNPVALIDALNALSEVETAYLAPFPAPPPGP